MLTLRSRGGERLVAAAAQVRGATAGTWERERLRVVGSQPHGEGRGGEVMKDDTNNIVY